MTVAKLLLLQKKRNRKKILLLDVHLNFLPLNFDGRHGIEGKLPHVWAREWLMSVCAELRPATVHDLWFISTFLNVLRYCSGLWKAISISYLDLKRDFSWKEFLNYATVMCRFALISWKRPYWKILISNGHGLNNFKYSWYSTRPIIHFIQY